MKFTKLTQTVNTVYLLSYTHNSTKLALACLPDSELSGGILRSGFARDSQALNRLGETCARLWPQAKIVNAPRSFKPDTERFYLYGTAFQQAVWLRLAKLQPGATISYGQLAMQIGHPTAYRAVGTAVGANPYAPFIPCHRVLAANGKIGGFAGGLDLKRQLLKAEGIAA